MKFNKEENWLGTTTDMSGNIVDGFEVGEDTYIVYKLHEEDQYFTHRPTKEIIDDVDKFMWTPYAILAFKTEYYKNTQND